MNKYHVEAEIVIHAPIHTIWKIMTEVKNYGEWNRFIRNIESPNNLPIAGTPMKFTVVFPNNSKATSGEQVKQFSPPEVKGGTLKAEWIYNFTGILHTIGMVRASRTQQLTAIDENTTHYYTCERFSGWGKIFLPLKNVRAGFTMHAEDLKKHCEKK